MAAKKLWAGRFARATDRLVEHFTASIAFDHVLYRYDIIGSIAHCRMLARQKIIRQKDARLIVQALREIADEIAAGKVAMSDEFEDIHMLIESRLIEKIGPVGGKLHTARSRNDQIVLDICLYLRDAIVDTVALVDRAQRALLAMAEKHLGVCMPGFTHLQHAQPVLLSHHMMAYFEMLMRDRGRLESCYARVNVMPLGAGALAGTPHPIDREYVAGLLGFPAVTANSMDTVSDRDALIEFCGCCAILMMHLSRFCEELILWSSPEFGFVEISDAFCTGSSIMPQKKNPDVPELVRGKSGRVYGNLMALLTLLKALPLTYNRDLQEDKTALFDSVETTQRCLEVLGALIPEIRVQPHRMAQAARRGFLTATDLADFLVGRGVPFRTAHEAVGRVVSYCEQSNRDLWDLPLEKLRQFSPDITSEALPRLSLEASVNSRTCAGATGTREVKRAIAGAKTKLRTRNGFLKRAVRLKV